MNIRLSNIPATNHVLFSLLFLAFFQCRFERDIADNGKIAVEMLQKKSYDIILMDLQMPEMNGFEATEYIRNTMNSKIPIIALTADVTTIDSAKCKAFGMNDYIAKPVDKKVLYSKIVGLVKKPSLKKPEVSNENENSLSERIKCIDLTYLNQRTKSNPALMMEMISLYLIHTPPLVNTLKQSLADKNWALLGAAAHKMIPSFSIMGISPNFENMAKKIQEISVKEEDTAELNDLVIQLEAICDQACQELEEALKTLKNTEL